MITPEVKNALDYAVDAYAEYGTYVAQGRAYPCIYDGCKSVVKRSVYGMYKEGPRSIVKLAKLAAYALPYHPHPTSISGAIIQLGDAGNKLKLIDTQGNWGNSTFGIEASAERYIGGKLSDTAINLLCDSIDYCTYMKGEIDEDEPVALPALIPLCFINGLEGIPSGLPKINIPTINVGDIFDYYLDILKHKDLTYVPKKLPSPNLGLNVLSSRNDWENILASGKGSIRVAPTMKIENNIIYITALPGAKNSESVRSIVEAEILGDKIDFRDESTDELLIVIEKVKNKSCNMKDLFDRLYKKLTCSIHYNMAFFDENKIYVPCGFDKVVKSNLNYVINTQKNRIAHELDDYRYKLKVLEIIEDLKSKKISDLFTKTYADAVIYIQHEYSCDDHTAGSVLQKPMSYLTKEHLDEITKIKDKIKELESDNSDIYTYLIKKYKLIKKEILSVMNKSEPTIFIGE